MILSLTVLTGQVLGQKSFHHKLRSPNIALEGRIYYGWTLDHHLEMSPFLKHYPAFEFSVLKATYGRTRWEYMYNYPFIGVSYWFSDLGGTKALGSAHAIFPYINFPLLRTRDFNIYFRLGVGLGYLTKKYDRYNNYENLAIGSHLNGAANLLIEARQRIGKRFLVSGGISLMHFSNGAIRQPNYGINMPGVNLAVAYRLSPENPYLKKKLMPELYPFEFDGRRFLQLDVNVGFGIKDLQSTLGGDNKYAVVETFANLMWPVSYKSRLGLGLDLSYDGSDEKLREVRGGAPPDYKIEMVKTGLTASYELAFSRMSFMFNLGSVVTGYDKSDGYIFDRIALQYTVKNHYLFQLGLKTHLARAEVLEFGFGYKF